MARTVRIRRTRAARSSRREWSFLGSLAAGIGSVLGYGRRAGAGFRPRHGGAKSLEEILTRARGSEQAGRYERPSVPVDSPPGRGHNDHIGCGHEEPMNIVLTAREADLADAWERHCGYLDGVRVHRGSILDVPCDAVVSPANSFGFMDGGIDLVYSRHFGWHVQERLQTVIRDRHHGELLVGAAEVVETGDARIPFVIAAPTMRVPMVLRDTVNPYLAARAVMRLVRHGRFADGMFAGQPINSAVSTVAFPVLGTGVGQVSPDVCARQVRSAIEEVVLGRGDFPRTWSEAQSRHQLLYTDRVR